MAVAKLEKNGAIATITITRPDTLNALGQVGDGDVISGLCGVINADRAIKVAILTGEGRAFSAGGDVKAMKERSGAFAGSPAEIRESYRGNIHKIIKALWNLEVPLISAVNGPAIGLGCDVACMGDIRIASETAKFGVTFLKLGLIPGDGGAWLTPRIIGWSRACELLFTGEVIDAETAREWGFVTRVVSPEALMDEARSIAQKIANQPVHALRVTKALMRQGQSAQFETIMELSAASQGLMHHTSDHAEGVAAVLEKRTPCFTGQ
ncbi:crotonase/enoyl-CoA hydratase family protein [Candidatus Phycosocius spiralis]|uniref:Enoyl-CoA hydratase n=1 Tax=Candidatus Phycosocius spiralis TaxID=2815099 RepID=A0ABQ4PWE2_9PROT|nr:crotonase/enoyl-CoA hydratase family protein [Candidatus Phycosocius spiralis]GIU67380.1 enoyl-CoA hydratase [Candidatus Phycosocius spiralis]